MLGKAWYFDKEDQEMLTMVNRFLNASPSSQRFQESLFNANLHPHGIKDLVIPRVTRVAYAVINLLTNLEAGQARDRLLALQALYEETLTSAHSSLRRNTARVLLQIMKELVRAHGDEPMQLKLAHDFRRAAQGTPRVVRKMLSRYHLPEMPEDWSQLAFDDHVYDANTKGRKTPTHLIMDAWIKGVRFLTVVYYNYVEPSAAWEILEAGAIMGMEVRIGLEFRAPFRGRFINLLWVPRGFTSSKDFLAFLDKPKMRELMREGRLASLWQQDKVLRSLEGWNTVLRPELEAQWETPVPLLSQEDFLTRVGAGQASRIHLAECLHRHVQPAMQLRAAILRDRLRHQDAQTRAKARKDLEELDALSDEGVLEHWLSYKKYPCIPNPYLPGNKEDMPEILRLEPNELISMLTGLHSGYRLVLSLADLKAEDVLELLWDSQCTITHLELFNIKEWFEGRLPHLAAINELQRVLNQGMGPRIKQMTREMLQGMELRSEEERVGKFRRILRDVPQLWEYYRRTPLKTRMGSKSASRSAFSYGMGLVYRETLPPRAQKAIQEQSLPLGAIPICSQIEERISYLEPERTSLPGRLQALARRIPGLGNLGRVRRREWRARTETCRVCASGNVVNLGGLPGNHSNGLLPAADGAEKAGPGLTYLSTRATNWLKVLAGFIPAFISFWYTQDWWFLAWFGTFIWFGITGVRNVIQMVVAGQGSSRTTLLRWKDHVSVSRICDSLMYTGISVLLLEVMVRVWMLEGVFAISVREQPGLVFTVLNVINGFYICAHNVYRGFPREAAIGNLFRSALAIPVSSLYNLAMLEALLWGGVADPMLYLAPSAAIISKLASDTVAAIIEGYADSHNNMSMRRWDYQSKLDRVFQSYTRFELLFPEEDVRLEKALPRRLDAGTDDEARRLELALLSNALDLMYFWFYQPRAQDAFKTMLRTMSQADRLMFLRSQRVLSREREVSQLFVDGLVGRDFSRPLSFFLSRRKEYLRAMSALCRMDRKGEGPNKGQRGTGDCPALPGTVDASPAAG